jgi:c-di-GMP-binding flagellar brake protein YcgR
MYVSSMDKREAARVPVRVRAKYRAHDEIFDGTVEDISRTGLLFSAPHRARLGDTAEIQLELSGEQLRIVAEVVRVIDEPNAALGLRFLGQTERTRRPLANFIMHASHASSH